MVVADCDALDAPLPEPHAALAVGAHRPHVTDATCRSGTAVTDPFERLKAALADRYAIEREIGAGGIYLARDLKNNRQVAIKAL